MFNLFGSRGDAFASMASDLEVNTDTYWTKKDGQFEIKIQDTLENKTQKLEEQLKEGEYELKIKTLRGKIKVGMNLSSRNKILMKIDKTLQGRRKTLEQRFQIDKEDAPCNIRIQFKDKSTLFWKKSSYDLSLIRIEPDPRFLETTDPAEVGQKQNTASDVGKQQKITVKFEYKRERRKKWLTTETTYSMLREHIDKQYGENIIIKYIDRDDDWITIQDNHDVQQFFAEFDKEHSVLYLFDEIEQEQQVQTQRPFATQQVQQTQQTREEELLKMKHTRKTQSMNIQREQAPIKTITPMSTPTPTNSSSSSSTQKRKITTWQKGNMLGSGSFGKVFLAFNNEDGAFMAVKEISCESMRKDSKELKELEKEIDVMSQLDHEHIVRYLGVQRTEKTINIFMDYIPGGGLDTLLEEFGLTENVIRKYSLQILDGLAYLHSKNIIHQDVKGGNILLDDNGVVYLADFGCAKQIKNVSDNVAAISGTPNYMAPEVIYENKQSTKADIWSFGCTIIEMLTKLPPWHHVFHKFDNAIAFFVWLRKTDETLLDKIPDGTSDLCRDFITTCLNKDPDQRPSAKALLSHPFLLQQQEEEEDLSMHEMGTNSSTTLTINVDDDEETDFANIDTTIETEGDLTDDEEEIESMQDDDEDEIEYQILLQQGIIRDKVSPSPATPHHLSSSTMISRDVVDENLSQSLFRTMSMDEQRRRIARQLLNRSRRREIDGNNKHFAKFRRSRSNNCEEEKMINRFLKNNAVNQTASMIDPSSFHLFNQFKRKRS
mmetsp:Transcript_6485/g.9439  ORF Transcript_6485/g.9439 Transcript_6485/m.9439 type:complete len:773 (+) Transcript_6485:144-2462(+)|eukprot:CAMPEP_0117422044 /NCGR_PEP_ID=MMETSP0758-20121206/2969_1 /TAXON_ID=63605 /ORGANISM="Percolomonas cosmopolitus, Strain AE-1 (ATCC 50343)" /LENGTH=772 /DNA_ID=CAMNT_0005204441 /DNA_START=1 /DNA_END=2319 /DNA_ORIENTATION=-